jgi:hypothetical protein
VYVPASQVVHDPPFTPIDPELHVQLEIDVEPAGDAEFSGQEEQYEDPVVS